MVFDKLPPQILLLVISRMLTQSFTEVAIKKHLALDYKVMLCQLTRLFPTYLTSELVLLPWSFKNICHLVKHLISFDANQSNGIKLLWAELDMLDV